MRKRHDFRVIRKPLNSVEDRPPVRAFELITARSGNPLADLLSPRLIDIRFTIVEAIEQICGYLRAIFQG